ncbi:MAG: VWA domain-containing protein [Arthrobacter sp.]
MSSHPPRKSLAARTASAAAALLLVVVLVPATVLLPAPPAASAEESVPVMVVLDASGSMAADDAPGLRIDAAKSAVKNLIGAVPDSARMGLMVYGTGTDSAPASKAAGCADIRTLAPVGAVDKAALTTAVDGIKASGYTPVGASLRAASEALADVKGPRSIILVSDGIDTCAPPAACDVAKELAAGGTELSIHSIGFKVDAAARAELECIAAATGGTYSDARDAAALTDELTIRTTRAIGVYEAQGTPITGGSSPADAPLLSAGQYLDVLEKGSEKNSTAEAGSTRYYKVQLAPGERAHAAATLLVPRRGETDTSGTAYVSVSLVDAQGESCLIQDTEHANSNQSFLFPPTAALSTPALGEDAGDKCFGADASGEAFLKVERSGNWAWTKELPVELLFATEPGADTKGLPDAYPAPLPPVLPAPGGTAAPVTGGASYNTAAELKPGLFSDSLLGAETKFYKIPVGYGQRLSFKATVTADGSAPGAIGKSLNLALFNPLRQETELAPGSDKYILGNSLVYTFIHTGDSLAASMAVPVRYNTRNSKDKGIELIAYPGGYYLAASVEDSSTVDVGSELSFNLAIDVSGDPEDGPPLNATAATAKPSEQPSEQSSPAAPDAGTAQAASTSVSAAPLWWGLGVGGLLAAGVGLFVLLRRRSSRRKAG